jgi:hypothetical protein
MLMRRAPSRLASRDAPLRAAQPVLARQLHRAALRCLRVVPTRDSRSRYAKVTHAHSGVHSDVYVGTRVSDGAEVILKVYSRGGPSLCQARAQREHDAHVACAGPGVPRAIELVVDQEPPLLVLERVPGITLDVWAAEREISPAAFLEIATQLADTLARIHAMRLVHGNVTPRHVLVEPDTLQTHLVDFEAAQAIGAARTLKRSGPGQLTAASAVKFIAPEQTGWLDRGCDARSDLYSLGATLYVALAKRPPFPYANVLEVVHAHLARRPEPPHEVRPDVPRTLSHIVVRLLQKQPEDRYQTARALCSDLRECAEQLARSGEIDPELPLGTAEMPERPRFVSALYGREAALAQLTEAYDRAAGGEAQAILIHGVPGAGKSSLLAYLRDRSSDHVAYVAQGAFSSRKEQPYTGWIEALQHLVEQLLIESAERLTAWRDALRRGLGGVAAVLVDLVPDLQVIVGEVPPVPALGPTETRARLALALARFMRVCAHSGRPLMILLDDIQWCDTDSALLLEELLCAEDRGALILVGACRAPTPGETHVAAALRDRVRARGVEIPLLEIGPIAGDAANAMLAAALERRPDDTHELARILERKTGNTPLLIRQLLEHFADLGLLSYSRGTGWTWCTEAVVAADIPEDAVALIAAKIAHLDPEKRAVLVLASCVGMYIDRATLCDIGGDIEHERVDAMLYALADQGILVPSDGGFRFAHERLREAAYASIESAERARTHVALARRLLDATDEDDASRHVFALVDHLRLGAAAVPEEMRTRALSAHVHAADLALAGGASQTAHEYLTAARELFRDTDWDRDPKACFELHIKSASVALQAQKYEAARTTLHALFARTLTREQQLRAQLLMIQALSISEDPDVCAEYCLRCLREHGIRWTKHPSFLRAWLTALYIRLRFNLRRGNALLLPAKEGVDWQMAPVRLMHAAGPANVRVDVRLAMLGHCLRITRMMRHGYPDRGAACYALATHAMFSYIFLRDPVYARWCAERATEVGSGLATTVLTMRAQFNVHVLLYPWLEPRRKALATVPAQTETFLELGDAQSALHARALGEIFGALAGDPVAPTTQRLEELVEWVRRSGLRYPEAAGCHRAYRVLCDARGAATIDARLAEHTTWQASLSEPDLPYTRTLWMMILCIHARFDQALAQSDALGDRLYQVVPFVHVADHTLYRGLAAAALADERHGGARRACVRTLRQALSRLRRWARGGPDFQHMTWLLDAERARLDRRTEHARRLYKKAARTAVSHEYPHHAALAFERSAAMLDSERRHTEAQSVREKAREQYAVWGAKSKVAELRTSDTATHARASHHAKG